MVKSVEVVNGSNLIIAPSKTACFIHRARHNAGRCCTFLRVGSIYIYFRRELFEFFCTYFWKEPKLAIRRSDENKRENKVFS